MSRVRQSALVILVAIGVVAPAARADTELRVGQPVEVALDPAPDGGVVADDVTVLDRRRSPKIRGEVRAVSIADSTIQILSWPIRVDQATRWQGNWTLDQLPVGKVIEVDARRDALGDWWATEIEVEGTKQSWKLKGTITGIEGQADDPVAVTVDGLRVPFEEGTDLILESDYVIEDLFTNLRADDDLGVAEGRKHSVGRYAVSGSFRHNMIRARAPELDEVSQRDLFEPSARLEASGPLAGGSVFGQLRLLSRFPVREVGMEPLNSEIRLRVYQLTLSRKETFGAPLGFVVGKMRVRDDREFLFDEYLDGLRLYYHRMRPVVLEASYFVPVVPLSDKFSTWNDFLAQARVYLGEKSQARVYAMWRDDSSARNRDSRYTGLSVHARRGPAKGWLEASHLGGEDKGLRQDAWALDVGLGLRAKSWAWSPSVWAGHARGSGDRDPDDSVSNEFRQTGYEDNVSRVWGRARRASYGELLDPELRNLRVTSMGVAIRPWAPLSIELIGHLYELDQLDDEFDGGDLELPDDPLDGVHRDIGHEIDLVLAWQDLFPNLHAGFRIARFDPGAAFPAQSSVAWLQRFELRWDF